MERVGFHLGAGGGGEGVWWSSMSREKREASGPSPPPAKHSSKTIDFCANTSCCQCSSDTSAGLALPPKSRSYAACACVNDRASMMVWRMVVWRMSVW
eukprot:3044507-Rhodomonas_salina.1